MAHLLAEARHPPAEFWAQRPVSSRLLEYEIWTRIHRLGVEDSHGDDVRALLEHVGMVALIPEVLERAREPWPIPVRTLDALHLASALFLADQGPEVSVASYDTRMLEAAEAVGLRPHPL